MASIPTPAEILEQEMHISDDKGPAIIASNAICFTVACVAVLLRFLSRRKAMIRYEADDWLILAGLFFTMGVVICAFLGPWTLTCAFARSSPTQSIHRRPLWSRATCHSHEGSSGFGKGTDSAQNFRVSRDLTTVTRVKLRISAEVIWGFAIRTTKGSLLYLYRRVFFVNRGFIIALRVTGVFVVCYCLVQSFFSIFQCTPVDSNWKIGVRHYCMNTAVGATVIAAVNALTDVVILILPMPLLCRLQKPQRQKLQIMGMFCLGGLVCFASIYRCVLTHEFSHTDPSYSDVSPEIWTIVELCIGILSACLPTMRPLFCRTVRREPGSAASEQWQDKSDVDSPGGSDQGGLGLQGGSSRSLPSQSRRFAHLGVLADGEGAGEGW